MDITKKAVSTISAVALAGTLGFCGVFGAQNQASAAETNSTEVTIKAAAADDPSQIEWTAPTQIPFAASADGTLVGPSADALQIQNESVFPIHLTKISVAAESGWNVVSDVTADTSVTDAVSFSVGAGSTTVSASDALSGKDVSTSTDFNMSAKDVSGSAINIDTSGNLARSTKDLSTAQKAATVSWTVAVGIAE